MVSVTLMIFILLFSAINSFLIWELSKSVKELHLLSRQMMYGESEVEGKTSYEIEKEQRERVFDERILQLQREVNSFTNPPHQERGTGIEAEILSNGLYNIPHGEVTAYNIDREDEIAD